MFSLFSLPLRLCTLAVLITSVAADCNSSTTNCTNRSRSFIYFGVGAAIVILLLCAHYSRASRRKRQRANMMNIHLQQQQHPNTGLPFHRVNMGVNREPDDLPAPPYEPKGTGPPVMPLPVHSTEGYNPSYYNPDAVYAPPEGPPPPAVYSPPPGPPPAANLNPFAAPEGPPPAAAYSPPAGPPPSTFAAPRSPPPTAAVSPQYPPPTYNA